MSSKQIRRGDEKRENENENESTSKSKMVDSNNETSQAKA